MSLKILVILCMTIAYCGCVLTLVFFHSEPNLAGMMCSQDKVEFQEARRSVIECVKLCAVNIRCHSLIFYHGNKTCFGLKVADLFLKAESFSMPGAVFYRPNTTPRTVPTTAAPAPGCNESIPMVEPLADSQFSASSEYDAEYAASSARLSHTKCWSPNQQHMGEYIQVDFSEPRVVTSIITRGDPDYEQWVQTYNVSFSNDCTTFMNIIDGSGNSKIFDGNVDQSSNVENAIEPPVATRCLRIQVVAWAGSFISIRLEAIGCLA